MNKKQLFALVLLTTVFQSVFPAHQQKAQLHKNLFDAIRTNNTASVTTLLKKELDINIKDKSGQTPLMIAVSSRLPAMVTLLLKHGADINKKNDLGKTPLMIAVENQSKKIVEALLEYEPNIEEVDKNGEKVLSYGTSRDIKTLLKDYRRREKPAAAAASSVVVSAAQEGKAVGSYAESSKVPSEVPNTEISSEDLTTLNENPEQEAKKQAQESLTDVAGVSDSDQSYDQPAQTNSVELSASVPTTLSQQSPLGSQQLRFYQDPTSAQSFPEEQYIQDFKGKTYSFDQASLTGAAGFDDPDQSYDQPAQTDRVTSSVSVNRTLPHQSSLEFRSPPSYQEAVGSYDKQEYVRQFEDQQRSNQAPSTGAAGGSDSQESQFVPGEVFSQNADSKKLLQIIKSGNSNAFPVFMSQVFERDPGFNHRVKDMKDAANRNLIHHLVLGEDKNTHNILFKDPAPDRDNGIPDMNLERESLLETLMTHGVFIDKQDSGGFSPLYYAVMLGRPEMTESLIKSGADIDIEKPQASMFGKTPIEFLFKMLDRLHQKPNNEKYIERFSEVLNVLIENGAKFKEEDILTNGVFRFPTQTLFKRLEEIFKKIEDKKRNSEDYQAEHLKIQRFSEFLNVLIKNGAEFKEKDIFTNGVFRFPHLNEELKDKLIEKIGG